MNRTVTRAVTISSVLLTTASRVVGAPASPNAGDAVSCGPEQIDKLVQQLTELSRRFHENEQRARAERGCTKSNVICLDARGNLAGDELPATIVAREPFSVYVVAPSTDTGQLTITTSTSASQIASPSARAPRPVPEHGDADCELSSSQRSALRAAASSLAPPQDDAYWSGVPGATIVREWRSFLEQHREVPAFGAVGSTFDAPPSDFVRIDFRRTERDAVAPCVEKRYDVPVDLGRYYLELGAFVPFVFRGARSIDLVPTPGTGDVRVAVGQDWHVTGGLAFDFFPGGRARALGSSFRNCSGALCWRNWLGVQLGAGFGDFPKEWYLGLLVQPVSGLNIDFGAALLKGDFLPAGYAEGMQLPRGTAIASRSEYMFRPYFALSLTLDALQSLDRHGGPAGQLF